jgi:16S rRNA (guanine1516-N2)-methyltransferase
MNTAFSIGVTCNESPLVATARKLAKKNLLPFVEYFNRKCFDYVLTLNSTGLHIEDIKRKLGSLKIDFLNGKLAYRLRHLKNQKQLLARAIGLKVNFSPTILDATAGLGSDSFILSQLGFPILLLERSPIIFLLLKDALHRALSHPNIPPFSMKVINIDALIYLKKANLVSSPDIIYLDPMYPHSSKSALVKREMCFLRQLVGDDSDAPELLKQALISAKQRVIVKRPRLSKYLSEIKPHHSLLGKQHRLDVYLTRFSK